jgi:hypothetical protein
MVLFVLLVCWGSVFLMPMPLKCRICKYWLVLYVDTSHKAFAHSSNLGSSFVSCTVILKLIFNFWICVHYYSAICNFNLLGTVVGKHIKFVTFFNNSPVFDVKFVAKVVGARAGAASSYGSGSTKWCGSGSGFATLVSKVVLSKEVFFGFCAFCVFCKKFV